jgi:hypothetical protein
MSPQAIAQWIVDHPDHIHNLAMMIAEKDYRTARDMAWSCDEASDYYTPEDDDSDDCDDGQALASAGWGTDEDYGSDDRM